MEAKLLTIFGASLLFSMNAGAEPRNDGQLDAHIRRVVAESLKEKDREIEELKRKVQRLESTLQRRSGLIEDSLSRQHSSADFSTDPKSTSQRIDKVEQELDEIKRQDKSLYQEFESFREGLSEKGLEFSGFFHFSALSDNKRNRTFEFGELELGLEYHYNEHLAASMALVWDGETADVGVAVIDYHWFDDNIPTRGRIFQEPGFHIQAGRFDLPFGIDYQYFAAPDRLNATAPFTTERIQLGGFNGDGVRSYGVFENLNYAVYWTNSVYGDDGMSIGARLGGVFGRTPYRLHSTSDAFLEVGLSALMDLDGDGRLRNEVYAADMNFQYDIWQLMGEIMWRNAREQLFDAGGVSIGDQDEMAYYVMLAADLETWLGHPVYAFARYERWHPEYGFVLDDEGTALRVGSMPRVAAGIGYNINKHLRLRFEYIDTFGHETGEDDFENSLGQMQLVVLF